MRLIYLSCIFQFLLIFSVNRAIAQKEEIVGKFNEYNKNNYKEKVYVTTDREFYLTGELLWFKVYCLDALHQPSLLSKVVYVEVIGPDSTTSLQAKINVADGIGSGSFFIPTTLNSSSYQLRAYTNWMKNYGLESFFTKEIKIVNAFKKLPSSTNPVNEDFSIQFFPEGGHLVNGLESRVAFEAVDQNGHGLNVEGFIVKNQLDTISTFNTITNGMGQFGIKPSMDDEYTAIVNFKDQTRKFSLPKIESSGFTLHVAETGADITIEVQSTTQSATMAILVHNNQLIIDSEMIEIVSGIGQIKIPKNDLKDGINRITVFNYEKKPVAERQYYKYPKGQLKIEIGADEKSYSKRQKVNLNIQSDNNGGANLSVSVFKLDSLNAGINSNIVDYLFFHSELNEQDIKLTYPLNKAKKEELDLVMLTRGWSSFNWDEVMSSNTKNKKHVSEHRGHLLFGKITNSKNGEPASNISAYLTSISKTPGFYNSKSDKNGNIFFELRDEFDKVDLVLQTNRSVDSAYNLTLSNPFYEEVHLLNYDELNISKEHGEVLNQRNIGMQVMNSYYKNEFNQFVNERLDSSMFFAKPDKAYFLDDYTRFTIMEDVMREYVYEVWVREKKGQFVYMVWSEERDEVFKSDPLVLYDGLPVFDINKIMKLDPLKVKKIEVVANRYFYGNQTYDGIVSYRSYNGDLDGFEIDSHSLILEYEGYQSRREFYSPNYEVMNDKRVPDFRNVLFWNPELIIDSEGNGKVDFFTADESGKYMVVVEGMSKNGQPGFSTFTFEVKDQVN